MTSQLTELPASATLHQIDSGTETPGDAIEYCFEKGWTDGLPVIPPDSERVLAMLNGCNETPDKVVAHHGATGRSCTVLSAAANAVMAGCRPGYFPVVLAGLKAMNESAFMFHGSAASTGGSAPLMIVSGPVAGQIGMNSGAGLFGPGNRANATIGRAIRLILMNVFQMLPGLSDQSTQGHPGKYCFCIAERQDANPWPSLSESYGLGPDESSVTVFAGAGFLNIENHGGATPEAILLSAADAMANLGSMSPGQSVIVLSPEHAAIVGATGWDRAKVQDFLYTHATRSVAMLKQTGKFNPKYYQGAAEEFADTDNIHRGHGPEDILLLVAGGDAGGHSAFIPSWSRGRSSLMQWEKIIQ